MMRAFQQACEQAVRQCDGTVVQCSEDGLLACFGYPMAYEDAAHRAARTGLAMLKDLNALGERLRREQRLELNPWVGIHTGPAVVEAGEESVSLVGEARNVAIRLEDFAEPGQIVCSAATHRLIRVQFDCTSLGHRKIKGIAQPVELFLVQGVAEARSPVEVAGPAGLTPLTGRDHEINLLKDRWEQAQEGMGQVVLLVGEPGLGKSRVVYTLKEHVLGQMVEGEVDSPVIEWRCSPHYQNTGLYPAIDFYERALAFGREESPSARFDRLLRRLEQYELDRPETVPLWAALLVAADRGALPPVVFAAGPAERGDVPGHVGVAAHVRRPETDPVRCRGPALGGRVHPGVPGAVPRRGPERLHPHSAYFPPRVQDAVACRRPPDQPGLEPPHPAPGRRPDAGEDRGLAAGIGGGAGLRSGRRRTAVRRRVYEDVAGVGRAGPGRARRRWGQGLAEARDPGHASGPGDGPPGPHGGRARPGPARRDARS